MPGYVTQGESLISRADVALLYRRAGFGAPLDVVDAKRSMEWEELVEEFLTVDTTPITRPRFLSDTSKEDWERQYLLHDWWMDRMRAPVQPLQEKMTFFWHGHFCSANSKVNDMNAMYDQQALFREQGMANFRDLVQAMSVQPAMLRYLDNAYNTSDSPNENFARELMELFTLGVNQYTQDDIVAAARAWSGHNLDDGEGRTYQFFADRHDNANKTFMGVTRRWDGPDIIDHILSGSAAKKRTAAQFIAEKLWRFFSYGKISPALSTALTNAFYDSDLDVTVLLRTIFNRPEFRSEESRTGLVRSPVEWMVALHRVLGVSATKWRPWDVGRTGQELFEPPNVAGWKRNDYWLSTTGMWTRSSYIYGNTWRINDMNPLPLAETMSMLPADAVQFTLDRFEIDSPSAATRETMRLWLRRQRADRYAWDRYQILYLVVLAALSPEFQLA